MAVTGSFQLTFPENQKRDANLFATTRLAFDDLGDFIEERNKVARRLEKNLETKLKVDYTDFANHVFFDTAATKFDIAENKVLTKFPFNGTLEEKDAFFLTSSGYEEHIFDTWPRFVGYIHFSGTDQYVSASDTDNKLLLGTSSLYASAWINPETINGENLILQKIYRNNNSIIFSDIFTDSSWTLINSFLSESAVRSPLGANFRSGSILVEGSLAAQNYRIQVNQPVFAGSEYEISVFAKAINRNWMKLDIASGVGAGANFDLVSGTVGTISFPATAAKIESAGNGWYRCSVNFRETSNTSGRVMVRVAESDDVVLFDGLSQDSIEIFGAELRRDTCPGLGFDYIVTSGSDVDYKVGYDMFLSAADAGADPHLQFTIYSGSSETTVSSSYTSFLGSFKNVAAIYDANADLLSLYVNSEIRDSASVSFGAMEFPPGPFYIASGSKCVSLIDSGSYDFYSGSIDEVRIFHTASELFHIKNYTRPIDAEDYLKLRYNFNEGVVGTASVDSVIVDYSKSGLHGQYINYVLDDTRVSGTVMDTDPGDPILYSFHDDVVAFTSSIEISASIYDKENKNNIFRMIPEEVIIEDDNADELLRSFALVMARYFDELKLFVDQFDNLKVVGNQDIDEVPDLFLPFLKKYFGWKVTEHFENAVPLQFFYGESVVSNSGSLEQPLVEIRNQFWKRILQNLPYLYKTKGKRYNLDAYFNVVGINKNVLNLKEYGFPPGESFIEDTRIAKEKVTSFLGFNTGSFLSASQVQIPHDIMEGFTAVNQTDYTIELTTQLPFASASYTGSLLTGALWSVNNDPFPLVGFTGDTRCYWVRNNLSSELGKIVMEFSSSTTNNFFSSSELTLFNGDFIYVAAGGVDDGGSSSPFIRLRSIEGCDIELSEDFSGTTNIGGVFSGSALYIGATSASLQYSEILNAQGFIGEVRFWAQPLSASEADAHALHLESVGLNNPLVEPNPLIGHWALNEQIVSDAGGAIDTIIDLSRNGRIATGSFFPPSENAYQKFLREYNYISPTIDLKWNQNKVRIRNKTELKLEDIANDTNEVSLEFNYIDALNEDISKIFATFDIINNAIGSPVNKYREEYEGLEQLRRVYFARLTDRLNFTNFFKLFTWFDKKISNSIKQLLPARTHFIGGEQVIESHMLERPRYSYKYPIFRTPQDIPEIVLSGTPDFDAEKQVSLTGDAIGTFVFGEQDKKNALNLDNPNIPNISERPSLIVASADIFRPPTSVYGDGSEIVDKLPESFFRVKVSGDTSDDVFDPNTGVNFKNNAAQEERKRKDQDNED